MIALLCLTAFGGPVSDGAEAWEGGDIEAAIQAWQPSVDAGWGSGRVKFNLGNAYYRRGDMPRAIAYYRAAAVYRPRSPGVSHNLALARSELDGVPDPAAGGSLWMRILTPGELGILGLLLAALASGGLVLQRRQQGNRLGFAALGILGAVLATLASFGWWSQASRPLAVVVDAPAIARVIPNPGADPKHTFDPGSELAVLRVQGDFLLVESGEGERGWVPDGAVLQVAR